MSQSTGGAQTAVAADSTPKPPPPSPPSGPQTINDYLAAHNIYYGANGIPYIKGQNATTEQVQRQVDFLTNDFEGNSQKNVQGGVVNSVTNAITQANKDYGITYESQTGNLVNGVISSGGPSPRDIYVGTVLGEAESGYKGQSKTTTEFLQNRLGQVGLSLDSSGKITDPLQIGIIQQQTENAKRVGLPGGGFGESISSPVGDVSKAYGGLADFSANRTSPSLITQENPTGSLDIATAGKTKPEAQSIENGLLSGDNVEAINNNPLTFSQEQINSLISSKITNKEYGGDTKFLVGNIGTENSTGPTKALNLSQARNTDQKNPILPTKPLEVQKSDISSLSNESLVNVGGTKVPATLLFVPTQEAVDKANATREALNLHIEQENALGQGLFSLSKLQNTEKRQLNLQQNENTAVNNAVDKLAFEQSIEDIINTAKAAGAKTIDIFENITNPLSVFPAHQKNLEGIPLSLDFIAGSSTIPKLIKSIPVNESNAKTDLISTLTNNSNKDVTLFENKNSTVITPTSETEQNQIAFSKANMHSDVAIYQKMQKSDNPLVRIEGEVLAGTGGFGNAVFKNAVGFAGLLESSSISLSQQLSDYIKSGGKTAQPFSLYPKEIQALPEGIKKTEGPGISPGIESLLSGKGFTGFTQTSNNLVYDTGYLIGDVGSYLVGAERAIAKISPIKFGESATIRFEGIGNVPASKALPNVIVQGEKTISASGVVLGFGKYSIGLGFRTSEGEVLPLVSTLNPETDLKSTLSKFTAISPKGAEAGYVTPLTVAKVYTPQGAQALADLGKITSEQQTDLINPASDVMKSLSKIKDVKISQTELNQMIQQTGLTDNPEVAAKITGVVSTVQNPGKTALAYMVALKAGDVQLANALKPFLNPLNSFPATKGSIVNILQLTKFNADQSISDLMLQEKVGSLGHSNFPEDNLVPTRPLTSMGDLMDVDLKAEKQSEQLLNVLNASKISDEGFGFGRSGLNITYGKAEEVFQLPKTKLKSNEALHGTAESGAENLVKKGPELTPEKQLFMTRNQPLAEHYGLRELQRTGEAPRFVKIQFNQNKILKFNELKPEEQNYLINDALNISKQEGIDKYQGFQRAMKQYAETKGFAGYEKPYDVKNPLKINAKQSEIVIFNQEGLKGINTIINPAITKEVTEGDKLLNLLGKEDEIGSELSVLSEGKSFGKSQPHKVITQGGLKTKTLAFQGWAKLKSLTSYQNLKTLETAKDYDIKSYEKSLERFQGMEHIVNPALNRNKDVVDALSILRYGEKTVKGKHGQRMGAYANSIEKHFTNVDFSIANKEVQEGRITVTNIPKSSPLSSINHTVNPTTLTHTSYMQSSKDKLESKRIESEIKSSRVTYESPTSKASPLSGKTSFGSISELSLSSIKSINSSISSPKSISSSKSPSSIKSSSGLVIKSPRSLVTQSNNSPLTSSPKSPTTPSPKSPLSPFTKSPGVPSPKSPSVSSSLKLSSEFEPLVVNNKQKKGIVLDLNTMPDQRVLRTSKTRYNYIGNSTEGTLVGLYNRNETIYGKTKTEKLSHKDYLRTTKGFPKLVNTKTVGLISTKKTSIGRKENKKRGVPKF